MSEYIKRGGDVLHCPKCGAIVPVSASVCPECGYEFSDIGANNSSVNLALLLAATDDYDEKYQIIETFPLPNSKADLIEFATALKPRIKKVNDVLAEAYMSVLSEGSAVEALRR